MGVSGSTALTWTIDPRRILIWPNTKAIYLVLRSAASDLGHRDQGATPRPGFDTRGFTARTASAHGHTSHCVDQAIQCGSYGRGRIGKVDRVTVVWLLKLGVGG
jgi:hypothetical protein